MRFLVILIGALLLGSPGHTQPASQSDGRQAAEAQANASAPAPAPGLSGDQPGPYQPACEAPESREDASFCEERRAAKAAERGNALSERMFWPTFFSLVVGAVSVIATAWAAVAASRAATAAELAVEQGAKYSRIQLRPYLELTSVGIETFAYQSQPTAHLTFTQLGQSPAVDTMIEVRIAIAEFPPRPGQFDIRPLDIPPSKRNVGPDQKILTAIQLSRPLTEEVLRSMQEGRSALYLWGEARYRDMIAPADCSTGDHVTTFRLYKTLNDGSLPDRMTTCAEGNQIT